MSVTSETSVSLLGGLFSYRHHEEFPTLDDLLAPPSPNTHRLTVIIDGAEQVEEHPGYGRALAWQLWYRRMGYVSTISEIAKTEVPTR